MPSSPSPPLFPLDVSVSKETKDKKDQSIERRSSYWYIKYCTHYLLQQSPLQFKEDRRQIVVVERVTYTDSGS